MNLADQIVQSLALTDADWVQFDTLALSLHPEGYTAEEATLIAAACRDLADEVRVKLNGLAGIIFLVRLVPDLRPSG